MTSESITASRQNISLSPNSNENREWVNLYTNEAIDYNEWSDGQPDNVGNVENVAEMLEDGKHNWSMRYIRKMVCICHYLVRLISLKMKPKLCPGAERDCIG